MRRADNSACSLVSPHPATGATRRKPRIGLANLTAATGKDFDKQFLQMMIVHHRGAIQMAQAEQAHGANPDAKALAGRIIKNHRTSTDAWSLSPSCANAGSGASAANHVPTRHATRIATVRRRRVFQITVPDMRAE